MTGSRCVEQVGFNSWMSRITSEIRCSLWTVRTGGAALCGGRDPQHSVNEPGGESWTLTIRPAWTAVYFWIEG